MTDHDEPADEPEPEYSPREAARRRRAAQIFPPRSAQNAFPNGRWTIPESGTK